MRSEKKIISDLQANIANRFAVIAVVRSTIQNFLIGKNFVTFAKPQSRMSFEVEKRKTYDHFVYFGSYVNVDRFDCLLQLNINYVISKKYQI